VSKTLPLVGVITLAVMLVAGIVALMNSIPLSIRSIYGYTKVFTAITPRGDNQRIDDIVSKVNKSSPVPVEKVLLVRSSGLELNSIVGPMLYPITAIDPEQMPYLMSKYGDPKIEGRLPSPFSPEAVISEPVARNLKIGIGSTLLSPDNENAFSPNEVKVVGIAQTQDWLVLMDRGYHNLNHFPPIDIVLAFAAKPSQQGQLDRWIHQEFKGEPVRVLAYHLMNQETDRTFAILYQILNVIIGVLVVVITIMMGMLISIYLGQRMIEFGLLQALGYTRKQLLTRCLQETGAILFLGWLAGILLAYLMLRTVDALMMYPRAFAIDTLDPNAYLYTIPIPLSIFIVAAATVVTRFRRYDPVSIVERRLI
jgi:ABC-type lipoprotein release transport system permease subunit